MNMRGNRAFSTVGRRRPRTCPAGRRGRQPAAAPRILGSRVHAPRRCATAGTARLVTRAREGDAAAFACLVERHGDTLRRFCARLAGADGSAEDLGQETLLRAFRALPGLGDPERFEAWLLAIAANLARTWWRQQARWPLSVEALQLAYPDLPWEGLP